MFKYFIHFCQAKKGDCWIAKYIQHFVPLGGPWLGAVQLMKTVMIDGSFEPLDLLFTESQMLTILRSVPVGRYLQPIGNWNDGLDLPFVLVRDQTYVSVSLGRWRVSPTTLTGLPVSMIRADVAQAGRIASFKQPLEFHNANPFVEKCTFVMDADASSVTFEILLREKCPQGMIVAASKFECKWGSQKDWSDDVTVTLFEPKYQSADMVSMIELLPTECNVNRPMRLMSRARADLMNLRSNQQDGRHGSVLRHEFGTVRVRVTVLGSQELGSRSRWKYSLKKAMFKKIIHKISLSRSLNTWRDNKCEACESTAATCISQMSEVESDEADEHHAVKFDDVDDYCWPETAEESGPELDGCPQGPPGARGFTRKLTYNKRGAPTNGRGEPLHPLEQHMGAQGSDCGRHHSKGEGKVWKPAHPLALQVTQAPDDCLVHQLLSFCLSPLSVCQAASL